MAPVPHISAAASRSPGSVPVTVSVTRALDADVLAGPAGRRYIEREDAVQVDFGHRADYDVRRHVWRERFTDRGRGTLLAGVAVLAEP